MRNAFSAVSFAFFVDDHLAVFHVLALFSGENSKNNLNIRPSAS